MASEKTLNVKNLAGLGAERLAELVLELSAGDAASKRKLRLELVSRSGGADVAPGRVRQRGVISVVAVGHRQAAFAVMCRG